MSTASITRSPQQKKVCFVSARHRLAMTAESRRKISAQNRATGLGGWKSRRALKQQSVAWARVCDLSVGAGYATVHAGGTAGVYVRQLVIPVYSTPFPILPAFYTLSLALHSLAVCLSEISMVSDRLAIADLSMGKWLLPYSRPVKNFWNICWVA